MRFPPNMTEPTVMFGFSVFFLLKPTCCFGEWQKIQQKDMIEHQTKTMLCPKINVFPVECVDILSLD